MSLNFSVLKSPSGVDLAGSDKVFDEQGGTIGRGDSNDWVLPDPDRFLSSRHCAVSFDSGQYYLTDTSTNGTFINGAPEPIGKGGTVALNNGDTIDLGDYQFSTSIGEVDSAAEPFGGLGAESAGSALGEDPLGRGDPLFDAPPSPATPDDDIFGSPMASSKVDDPFASSPAEQNDPFAASDDVFGSAPADDPFGKDFGSDLLGKSIDNAENFSIKDIGADEARENVDPLAALDASGLGAGAANRSDSFAPAEKDPFSAPAVGGSGNNLDDIFGSPAPTPAAPFSTQGDNVDPLNQSINWPDASPEAGAFGQGIPEDWDDDLMGSAPAEPAPPSQLRSPTRSPAMPGHQSHPLTDPPQQFDRSSLNEDLLQERRPERVEQLAAKARAQASAPLAPNEAQSQMRAKDVAPEAALLEGLGLLDKNLTSEQIADIYRTVGELIPVIINGMMQVLRSRASIKNEFRMNVTTIQPIENNPLKFSATAEDAIENLFVRKSSAYKEPIEAFQEGFDSIGEHQVAIIAGIRAAFKSLMDRFEPDQLERQFDRQVKGGLLPGMQKAKYWNCYADYYKGFSGNMENSFQYLFGDEFVQAYEEQLRKLAVERRRK